MVLKLAIAMIIRQGTAPFWLLARDVYKRQGLCSNPIDVSTGAANDLSGLAADMAAQEGSLAGKMSEGKGSKNFNGASVADGGFDAVIRDKALGTDAVSYTHLVMSHLPGSVSFDILLVLLGVFRS